MTDLDDSKLMSLLSSLTRWADYSGASLATAAVEEKVAESAYERAKAIAVVRDWGGGKADRVNIAKARQESDPDVAETKDEYMDAYAYRKLLEARHEAFVRDAAVVSRELTRRLEREAPVRRNDRYNA